MYHKIKEKYQKRLHNLGGNMQISFSVDLYDADGDRFEEGVYLHIEPNMILEFNNSDELKLFAEKILTMIPEIKENEARRI